jgi:hypothetical protein
MSSANSTILYLFHVFSASDLLRQRIIRTSMRRKVIANHLAVLHHESNAF